MRCRSRLWTVLLATWLEIKTLYLAQTRIFAYQAYIFGSFGLSTKEPYTVIHHVSLVSMLVLALASVHTSLATGLQIEVSYLVYICIYVPHICTSNI